MNFEEWLDKYKPVNNHLVNNASFQDENGNGIMFETYGIELGYVLGVASHRPNTVWTYVDGDEGTYVTNGYHLVNRIGYFITSVPYDDEGGTKPFLDVLVDEYEPDEADDE
jgi:phosphate-selective porin